MSQHQHQFAHAEQAQAPQYGSRIAKSLRQTDHALDLVIIEAGLRLKVLPLRDAVRRGKLLRLSNTERRARQRVLLELGGWGPLRVVDIGLFADAVARRPGIAEQLSRATRLRRPHSRDQDELTTIDQPDGVAC